MLLGTRRLNDLRSGAGMQHAPAGRRHAAEPDRASAGASRGTPGAAPETSVWCMVLGLIELAVVLIVLGLVGVVGWSL
jgi:hypothetical protein